jgi:hypothetical protein
VKCRLIRLGRVCDSLEFSNIPLASSEPNPIARFAPRVIALGFLTSAFYSLFFGMNFNRAVKQWRSVRLSDTFDCAESLSLPTRRGSACSAAFDLYRRHAALVALAFSLGLALFFEICPQGREVPQTSPAPLPIKIAPPSMQTGLPTQSAVRNWAAIAAARPLFNPDRSPFQLPAPAAALAAPLPRLTGIIVTSHVKIGIFSGADGVPVIAKAGGVLGAFKLLSIGANSVRLSGASGFSTLHVFHEDGLAAPGQLR